MYDRGGRAFKTGQLVASIEGAIPDIGGNMEQFGNNLISKMIKDINKSTESLQLRFGQALCSIPTGIEQGIAKNLKQIPSTFTSS